MASRFAIETIFSARDRMTAPVSKMRAAINGMRKSAAVGFGDLNKTVDSFNASLLNAAKSGVMAFTGATVAAVASLKAMADTIGDLEDESIRLDFPIEEFQIYRGIAGIAGVSTGELSAALSTLNRNVGKAKQGQGGLASALKKTNPALLNQLKNSKNTAQAFDIAIEAIRSQTSASAQAAVATTIFGKAGGKLINVAKMSREEMAKLRAEFIANGVLTAESAADAAEFGDSIDKLTGAFSGMRNAALLPLMPILTQLADEMRGYLNTNREFVAMKIHEAFTFLRDNAEDFGRVISGLFDILKVYLQIMIAIKGVMIVMRVWTLLLTAANWAYTVSTYAITAAIWLFRGAMLALNVVMGVARVVMFGFAIAAMAGVSPILLIIAAVGALVAAVYLLYQAWGPVTEFFSGLWSRILEIFRGPIDTIKGMMNNLFGGFSNVLGGTIGVAANAGAGSSDPIDAPGNVVTSSEQLIKAAGMQGNAVIDINDKSGMASIAQQPKSGLALNLRKSGAF